MSRRNNEDRQSQSEHVYATRPIINRVALIFDFDKTLAPDSFSALLEHCGYDADAFKEDKVQPLLEEGWDEQLARFHILHQESVKNDDLTITADTFADVGSELELYPEVEHMFQRVRDYAQAIIPDVEVEFYLLTAGMLEIPRATDIAGEFRTMWGGELHFEEESGELEWIKRQVSHPDKIRYLLKLCKGLDVDDGQINENVYRDIPADEWHVPLSQIVYVGDGDSDMPVFFYLAEHEGLAIGVHKTEEAGDWEGYEELEEGIRAQNLAPAGYGEDDELMQSLKLCVESICKRIALRQLSPGE